MLVYVSVFGVMSGEVIGCVRVFEVTSGGIALQLHSMGNRMWTPARRTPRSKIMGINMEKGTAFSATTASTLLGKLSTRC